MATRDGLPPEIEDVVRRVLRAAALGMTDGRAEVERELHAHFEDGLERGMTAAELIRRFGDPEAAGRSIAKTRPGAAARNRGERGRWWMNGAEWVREGLRAGRRLRRSPGFAVIVVTTLALGVGVNTAVFSVLNAVMLQDLPYAEPDRLVRVYETHEQWGMVQYMRGPAVSEYRSWNDVFDDVAALYTYRQVGADLTDGDVPQRVTVLQVTAGYFETLGRAPLVGRTFREDESWGAGSSEEENSYVARAVLSHGLWTRRFGGDPAAVGRSLELDGVVHEVVGVMPASFRDPFGHQADLWLPQDMRPGNGNSFGNFYLSGLARLKDGITVEAAQERLGTLAAGLAQSQPELSDTWPTIRPLQADIVGDTRRTMLWILAAAAALVLLTACVNVGNLLFARGLAGDRDLALRAALGSGRGRLIAGILIENGILAVAGGAAGLILGRLGLEALLLTAPDVLPVVTEVGFGMPVFLFALSITVLALTVFGLTPALRMSRTAPSDVLRSGDRTSTTGRFVRRLRDGLVIVQVGAALVIVTGALLLTRSFDALLDVPLAIEADGVLTYEVHLPTTAYPETEDRERLYDLLQARVASLPGVTATGATSWLPVNGRYHSWAFYYDPENPDQSNDQAWYNTDVRVVHGDLFAALGIDLVAGRSLAEVDIEAEPVVWVNQEIVRSVLTDGDPLDQSIWVAGDQRRVAGVVEDVPYTARGDVSRKVYVPHLQERSRNWALIQTVRTDGPLNELRESIRAELSALDPNLVLYRPASFDDLLGTVRAQDRFATLLMSAFGALALLLSLVGTYGVLAGTVAGRTREIGIRMALGADTSQVRRLVIRHATTLLVPGLALGATGAWAASRWIRALLFGVEAGDPLAYAGAIAVFAVVGGVAAWIPARRATRVDTVQAISAE